MARESKAFRREMSVHASFRSQLSTRCDHRRQLPHSDACGVAAVTGIAVWTGHNLYPVFFGVAFQPIEPWQVSGAPDRWIVQIRAAVPLPPTATIRPRVTTKAKGVVARFTTPFPGSRAGTPAMAKSTHVLATARGAVVNGGTVAVRPGHAGQTRWVHSGARLRGKSGSSAMSTGLVIGCGAGIIGRPGRYGRPATIHYLAKHGAELDQRLVRDAFPTLQNRLLEARMCRKVCKRE